MRRLLADAQAKFKRMVDENRQLVTKIDSDITVANKTMNTATDTNSNCTNSNGTGHPLDDHLKVRNDQESKSSAASSEHDGISSSKSTSSDTPDDPLRRPEPTTNGTSDSMEKEATSPTSAKTSSNTGGGGGGVHSTNSSDCLIRPFSPLPGPSSKSDYQFSNPSGAGSSGSMVPSNSSSGLDGARSKGHFSSSNSSAKLKLENDKLRYEMSELKKLLSAAGISYHNNIDGAGNNAVHASAAPNGGSSRISQSSVDSAKYNGDDGSLNNVIGTPGYSEMSDADKVKLLEEELTHSKEVCSGIKAERKKLKTEKFDLLNQMKQLYATLEDKEKELRDFIRNFEQRMRENEELLSQERSERERERWSLLRHARDEAERCLSLAAQLDIKDQQLLDTRRQLSGGASCLSDQESVASMSLGRGINGTTLLADRGSCSADSGVRGSSDRESAATSTGGNLSDSTADGTPTITVEPSSCNVDLDSVSLISSIANSHLYQSITTPRDCSSPSLSPLNVHSFDGSSLSRSVEQLHSPPNEDIGRRGKQFRSSGGRSGVGSTWGSISRVFARSRQRKVPSPINQPDSCDIYGSTSRGRSWSPLTEEGYAEKLRLLREAASIPMERWRAPTVLAWLEIALGMPQYGPKCADNVKSGKVLLELSDGELETGLGIMHPMHRKKLRLAIEEHRHPANIRFVCIAQLGHTWVSSEWLPDLGLPQYADNFATNMVDARMLDHLSKKELEKFLAVTRKFHQASIVHGIHLLRMMKYDRQALAVRRHQCENIDADPLVWTNQRFIKWARNIDLGEYAENLKDSGVHGALVVLEPSLSGDTMATALGIPPSKTMIRRHLAAELEQLILPARSLLEMQAMYSTR
uniref:Kazrin n=3 Tax=Cacopsylla melanoneura TaxID=428564 RepID=A0A8D8YP92_9HEMI